jgi:membrane protein YdbS with pleckstrin-like domain
MEMKKLSKSVLKLWYIRAAVAVLALLGALALLAAILMGESVPGDVMLAVMLSVGLPVTLIICFLLILPVLRHKMYAWGYDEKRIVVKQGVIFRHKVVIPVCQIQDLHRTQGPIMTLLKLSGVTISTAGSNFDISVLTTDEADQLIYDLEHHLAARIEEQRHEEI